MSLTRGFFVVSHKANDDSSQKNDGSSQKDDGSSQKLAMKSVIEYTVYSCVFL